MGFREWLEEQDRLAEAAAEKVEAPAETSAEEDPLAKFIGKAEGGLGAPTSFEMFLDQVEAEKPADFKAPTLEMNIHDWQIVREAVYAEDHVVWQCAKCFRTVSIERVETIDDALKKRGIMDDCGLQIIGDIQDE